jgi:hypothetical protein
MIVYNGSLDDTSELIQFFRQEQGNLRALRRVVISRGKTVVWDVNRETIEFPGLTYGSAALEELLRELGVVFTLATLHTPSTANGVMEFDLSSRWTWGHDRVM